MPSTAYSTHTHLGPVQTDDPIYIPGAVEEVGDGDSVFTGGDPVLLGVGVDLEDVGPGAEDGLLSAQRRGRDRKGEGGREAVRKCFGVRLSFL